MGILYMARLNLKVQLVTLYHGFLHEGKGLKVWFLIC